MGLANMGSENTLMRNTNTVPQQPGGQGGALPPPIFFSEIGHFENSNIFPLDI